MNVFNTTKATVGDFNTTFTKNHPDLKKKKIKQEQQLNYATYQTESIDTYRMFHQRTADFICMWNIL